MAVRHDFEDILDSAKAIMIANLNTKLIAVKADKGDNIDLPPMKDNAYFMQSLDDRAVNFDPFIVYGIEDIQSVVNGPMVAEKIFISVVVVLADNGRSELNRVLFRYSRALKEIFQENWQIHESSTKINITRGTVVPFQALDSSAIYKAIGIEFEVNLAS